MYAMESITMSSGMRKESSDSADGKTESIEGKGEDMHAQPVSYINMEETVLGPYSTAAGGYGIDDFGFHLYSTLMARSCLTAQETAFMERYKLYQAHLAGLVKECMNGINSTKTGHAVESERKAKISRTDARGDYESNLDAFILNMLAEIKEAENAQRIAQGLSEKTSKDNSDQVVYVDSDSDCEIVEDMCRQGGQSGAASAKNRM